MAEKRMNDSDPVVGFDKTDHTPPPVHEPGVGDALRGMIEKMVGATPVNNALKKK